MEAVKVSFWRNAGPLEIGGTIYAQGRGYRLFAVEDYVTKTGRKSALLTWQGKCVKCGAWFEFKTGRSRFNPVATCEHHRQGRHL